MEAVTTVFKYKKLLVLIALALAGALYFGFLKLDFSFTGSHRILQLLAFLAIVCLVALGWKQKGGART
jgi:hypothetical protein